MNKLILELSKQADEYADSLGLGGDEWRDAQNKKFVELIVRELVSKLEVEGSDVWHNQSNDWGAIKIKHFVDGDPNQMLGEEVMAQYANGTVKGSGRYRLNDRFAQHLMKQCFGDES